MTRQVGFREAKARGCAYCSHHSERTVRRRTAYAKGRTTIGCPFDGCPYRELDGNAPYESGYMAKFGPAQPG